MTPFEAILEGTIQGLTEFLPISSSGHLHIVYGFFNKGGELPLIFTVVLHFFSLLAVILVFRKKIWSLIVGFFKAIYEKKLNSEAKYALFVVAGTIPTVIIGLLFEDYFEKYFTNPIIVSSVLIVNGFILYFSKFFQQKQGNLTLKKVLIIGTVQGMAILPGISRSGSTISAAILLGVDRKEAGTFSFLLSIPAILGASIYKLKDFTSLNMGEIKLSLLGAVFAFVIGWISLVYLLKLIQKGKFYLFAYYCWLFATPSLIYFILR